MTTEKSPLKIDYWEGGLLKPNAVDDPRPEPDPKLDYEEWMASIDWCHVQTLGSAMGGFSVEVWNLKEKNKWIMCIDAGGGATNDVLVIGFADYLDMMAMMAPIATASMLEGDTLADIFRMHRHAAEQHKALKEVGETIVKRVNDAMSGNVPCDCPRCQEIAKKKSATAN